MPGKTTLQMKLKTIEVEGAVYAEVNDGRPVYLHDDGKEVPFDAPAAVAAITARNTEAKTHREAKEAALAKLQLFEGLEPEAARAALQTVRDIGDNKLIHAGKLDEVRAEAQRVYDERLKAIEEKYAPVVKERDSLQQSLNRELIGGSFGRSKFVADKLAVPREMVEAYFGSHFQIDGGKVTAKGPDGNPIYSRSNPGIPADFDEALEFLVTSSPFRDSILKGSGASGGGASGGSSTPAASASSKNMARAAFVALSPAEQMAHVKSGGSVTE
jgi:hypothetical protein